MEFKEFFFILTLAKTILVKSESKPFATPCEIWSFNGQYVKDYNPQLQKDVFNYT